MATDKKTDVKKVASAPVVETTATETKTTVEAPSESQTGGGTALVQIAPPKASGIVIPTGAEIQALTEASAEKLQAVIDLISDTTLTDEERARVSNLAAQANPVKEGMEEVTTTWAVPRIQISQPTTQATARPEACKPGGLFTTAGGLLEAPFSFIPLYFSIEHIMFVEGQKNPQCGAPDGKLGMPYGVCLNCPHLPFGQQNGGRGDQKKTDCQNQIVVAMMASDMSQVYMCQFGKTSRGTGSALLSLAKAQPYPWKQSYLLRTEKKTGQVGVYYVYKVEPTGKDNTPGQQKIAKAFSQLHTANRKRFLADYYLRAGSATLAAAQSEVAFDPSVLAAGLEDGGGEPDLSPVVPAATTAVRGSSKPM